MSLKSQYQNRADSFAKTASQLESKYMRFSLVRLFVFVAAIALFIFLFSVSKLLAVLFILVFLVGFGFLFAGI